MTGNTIFETHKGFLLLNTFFGHNSPTIPQYSHVVQLLLKYTHMIVSFGMLFSGLAFIYGISNPENTLEQLCSTITILAAVFFTVFNSFYFIYRADYFDFIISLFNDLISKFMNDPFGANHFRVKLNAQYKILMVFYVLDLACSCIASLSYLVPIYLHSFKSLGFSGDRDLPITLSLPIDYRASPLYEIVFICEIFVDAASLIKKLLSEMLIITLLHIVCLFLQHLKYSLDYVFSEINDDNYELGDNVLSQNVINNEGWKHYDYDYKTEKLNKLYSVKEIKSKIWENTIVDISGTEEDTNHKIPVIQERLEQWAKLHQDVLKLCSELVKFLDPILTVYLCCITVILTLTAFTSILGFAKTISQISAGVFYYLSCLTSLFLLCYMGDSLTYESRTVADAAFYSKWYNTNKKNANSLKIIFQRVKTPVIMTGFRSPNFDLSISTFLVFVKSTISFFLAVTEFQKRHAIKNN